MKYVILLGDGMADYPLEELDGKTPLEYARTPNMDKIAKEGTLGLIDTIPAGFSPGSDVAIMSVLGYNPEQYYTGRGPLEAANMGVQLGEDDVAFRCNLVTLGGDAQNIMDDFTAGHITSQEAKAIIADINSTMGTDRFQFYPGVSYRHLCVWRNGKALLKTTPPHDITGKEIRDYLPRGEGEEQINSLMKRSQVVLADNPVNTQTYRGREKTGNLHMVMGAGKGAEICKTHREIQSAGGNDIGR